IPFLISFALGIAVILFTGGKKYRAKLLARGLSGKRNSWVLLSIHKRCYCARNARLRGHLPPTESMYGLSFRLWRVLYRTVHLKPHSRHAGGQACQYPLRSAL